MASPAAGLRAEGALDERAVVFLHIAKTAGTAVHQELTRWFRPEEVCPMRLRFLDQLSTEDLQRYRLFSGHYYWDQLSRLPSPRIVITFLREPRARLLSLYYFYRSHRWSAIEAIEKAGADSPRKAKECRLGDFLRSRDFSARINADNAIARSLLGMTYVDSRGKIRIRDHEAVETAIAHLRQMNAFGLIERYKESALLMRRATGLELPAELPVVNDRASLYNSPSFEAVETQDIDRQTEAEIQRCIRLDKKIYQWAVREFERRVRECAV